MSAGPRPRGTISVQRLRLAELLERGATRSHACQVAGVSRSTFYSWLRSSPEFRELIQSAESAYLSRAKGLPEVTAVPEVPVTVGAPPPAEDANRASDVSVPHWLATLVAAIAIMALFTFLFSLPGT
jgi:transposase-like protein